jgi:hypothetical protein
LDSDTFSSRSDSTTSLPKSIPDFPQDFKAGTLG